MDHQSYLTDDHGGSVEVVGGGFIISSNDTARRAML